MTPDILPPGTACMYHCAFLFYAVLWIKPRALGTLDKHTIPKPKELHPLPLYLKNLQQNQHLKIKESLRTKTDQVARVHHRQQTSPKRQKRDEIFHVDYKTAKEPRIYNPEFSALQYCYLPFYMG